MKSLQNAEKNPAAISDWIEKVSQLRKNKTASQVDYSKKMPQMESLLQVWPDNVEAALKTLPFPDESINMSVDNYAKILCNMLDVPVHILESNRSLIEALHVVFTLYSEFRNNQGIAKSDNVQSMKFY